MMTCSKQLLAKVNNLIHLYNECLLKQCLKNNRMIDDHKLYVGHDVQHTHTRVLPALHVPLMLWGGVVVVGETAFCQN